MEPDPRLLARFEGAVPPAPAWFDAAMADAPTSSAVQVEGAAISYLAWGRPGAPGLLLVHGSWAHCWWWAHLAPSLALTHHVVALSLSGMGMSGWRDAYSVTQYARELKAVAAHAGLAEGGRPVIAAHSFGCAPTCAALVDPDDWAAGAILVDGSISMIPTDQPPPAVRRPRLYATEAAALARFRLLPADPFALPYVANMIARRSLRHDPDGWRWSFDPDQFARCAMIDSRAAAIAARRPLAHVRGSASTIMTADGLDRLRRDLPATTRFVEVAEAGHHVMLDQPLALLAALRGLLDGWPPS